MDDVSPGSIVIHGDAKVRGTIGGGVGTFSGVFSADTVDAVDTINIRDGAVSTYYNFTAATDSAGFLDTTFTLPAQPFTALYRISLGINCANYEDVYDCDRSSESCYRDYHYSGIRFYRNGSVVTHIRELVDTKEVIPMTFSYFDVRPAGEVTTYKIDTTHEYITDSGEHRFGGQGGVLYPSGTVSVEFRKR